jgi:hypothetical protein
MGIALIRHCHRLDSLIAGNRREGSNSFFLSDLTKGIITGTSALNIAMPNGYFAKLGVPKLAEI